MNEPIRPDEERDLAIWHVLRRAGTTLASELDPERLVQVITDAAVELTGAAFGAFFYNVVGADGEAYRLYTLSGAPPEAFAGFPMPRNTAVFAPTFKGEGVVRSDDILDDPRYGRSPPYHGMPPGHLPVRSYLAVPVASRASEVHGGLFFGHPEPGVFTRRDELVVESIAALAATAIDNARLFQANERAREELRRLNEALERRIAERSTALQRSELEFQRLVSGIDEYAIYLLDTQGRVVTWNSGAERIHRYAAEEVIGRSVSLFYSPDEREAGTHERALAIARERGKYVAEGWRVRKDGSVFWASVLLDAIHEDGRLVGFAKVTRDMTQSRAMEEQLRQAQKMEAVGQLTGGVAHDFNNLLTVILGNVDAAKRCADDAERQRLLDRALRGAQRAAKLTQQLLAFSRRQPLDPRPTDVNRLVAHTAELLQRTLGETIAVETVLAPDLWRIEVDAAQLENALINLAVNARDAMPQGGRLTMETVNVHLDEGAAAAALVPGQYVAICVSDTGVGMPKSVLERAFDPFFTTKSSGQGTGLGLSQVYGFVKQSGGHVRIHSEEGRGTTVKIYLRRLLGPDAADPAESPDAAAAAMSGAETILLMEDDADVRAFSAGALRERGFRVLEAADAAAALDALQRDAAIALLVTDVGLPGLGGRELVEQARRRRGDLKVLFTTGYAPDAAVLHGRIDGAELVAKPYTVAELVRRVRAVLDGPPPQESA